MVRSISGRKRGDFGLSTILHSHCDTQLTRLARHPISPWAGADDVAEEGRPNQLWEELNEKMKKVDAGVMKGSSRFLLLK